MAYSGAMTQTPLETVFVTKDSVACDGGEGAIGHPRVYLTMESGTNSVDCPYCGKHFVCQGGAHAGAH